MSDYSATRMMTMAEASAFLRCSRSHLSNLLNGKVQSTPSLPFVRVGRRVLFRQQALEAWLRNLEQVENSRNSSSKLQP